MCFLRLQYIDVSFGVNRRVNNIMGYFYKLFLTMVAISLVVAVFLIQQKVNIIKNFYPDSDLYVPDFVCYFLYFTICALFAKLTILLTRFLSVDKITQGSIKELEVANDSFLPSYLGYFFVALSINDVEVFLWVFSIILIFIFFSRAAYFNPLYFIFGYKFYYVVTTQDVKNLIITKKQLKTPKDVQFEKIRRINDFTYIDVGER